MLRRILCIDDDEKILRGYSRQLRSRFDLVTATGGEAGLELINTTAPFAVVVVDMRMPGMDGLQVLDEIQRIAPDSVRMMLTGNADVQTAVNAINQGHIFRFLTKPCESEDFAIALEAGIRQHQLVTAERDLLGDTLAGSIKVLTDILALMNPQAFGRSARVRRVVKHIAKQLGLKDVWEFEMAGALSQIGCVSLPPEVLEHVLNHDMLNRDEQTLWAQHPDKAYRLLRNIPRMENIAQIVAKQHDPHWMLQALEKQGGERISIGAQILKVSLDLDEYLYSGLSFEAAWRKMLSKQKEYNTDILDALMDLHVNDKGDDIRRVTVAELCLGMITRQNIMTPADTLLVAEGTEVTYPILEQLRQAAGEGKVAEPFKVKVAGWIGFDFATELRQSAKPTTEAQPANAETVSVES